MVDEEIVMDTIRKMKESGLETPIILSTLQDIGLTEEQANQFIARASGTGPPAQPGSKPVSMQQQQPAQQLQPQPVQAQQGAAQAPTAQQASAQAPAALNQNTPLPGYARQPAQATQPFPAGPIAPQPLQQQPLKGKLAPQPQFAGSQVQGALPPQTQVQVQQPVQPLLSPQAVQAVQPQSQIPPELRVHLAERSEEDSMRHAQTQSMLADQSRQISEVKKTVNKVVKKIEKIKPIKLPPGTSAGIKAIAVEIESLRRDVEETRAMASATKTLMEKILEVNRKILGRLP